MSRSGTIDARAWAIAANARRYELIARRPEFQSPDRGVRIAHALAEEPPGELVLFDVAMVIGASEIDRFCGYVVSALSSGGAGMSRLLDVLGVLDDDRVAAIYYALPEEARERVLRLDGAFAVIVSRIESAMPDAEAALRDLLDSTPTSEIGYRLARLDLGLASIGS
jgi:hypothetical protein